MKHRPGFTLVELAVVVLIISILAAVAAPRLHDVRVQTHIAVLSSDLRGLALAEDLHQAATGVFVDLDGLTNFEPSRGVSIEFRWLQAQAYAARATHAAVAGLECWYISGAVPPGHTKPVDGAARTVLCAPA